MIINDGENQENLSYFNSVILCDQLVCVTSLCSKHKAVKWSESCDF